MNRHVTLVYHSTQTIATPQLRGLIGLLKVRVFTGGALGHLADDVGLKHARLGGLKGERHRFASECPGRWMLDSCPARSKRPQ